MKKTITILFGLICCYSLMAQDFTFALLTDTHISHKNKAPEEDLRKVIKEVNQNKDIEFVVVSGDISEEGDFKSLNQAKGLLDLINKKTYVIPGNHETKWTESGMTDFSQIFGSERIKFKHNGFLFLGFNTGPLMRMADGHVVPQDITWLKEELEKEKETPTFLVTHYPLKDGDVDNWYDVTDAVRPYNIVTFLGGHYHSNRFFHYDGIPGILSPSTLRGKENVVGYTIITVKGNTLTVSEKRIGEEAKQWASLDFSTKGYTLEGSTDKYPSYAVNSEYTNVQEKWVNRTGVGIYGSPAIYKSRVYVGDDMGYFTAYDVKNGKEIWSYQVEARIVGTPEVKDGVAVFGSADHHIYGLNAKNGKLLWKVKANAAVLGATTIAGKTAYIGASDGAFRAIDIKTGKVNWTYNKVKDYIETKPLVIDNKVIFGAWDNTLYALNTKTGKEEWLWTGDIKGMHFSPAAVWPVSANGKVFITDPKRAMTAIDLTTGETVWRTSQSMVRETIGLSIDQKRIYSKTMNDSIVCYSAISDTPQQIWATDVGFGYEHAPSMQVEKDGVMYGSTKNGLLFALDAFTGEIIWKHKVGNSLISTVVPIGNKRVLFTATGGEVGLLEWK